MFAKTVLSYWVLAARPKTLLAGICPVVMGCVLAIHAGVFDPLSALCALFGAMAIQIGTNFANDYFDFKKGADTAERVGPKRMTQAGLISPQAMKKAFILAFAFSVLVGAYLMFRGGFPIIAIGILSIICGILYTGGPYPLGYHGFGELFAFVFFGPVAVAGTYYVQALSITPVVILFGVPSGLFSVMLILVNNIRDVIQDEKAGKRTIIVRWGTDFGKGLYIVSLAVAALLPLVVYPWHPIWIALPIVMGLEFMRVYRPLKDGYGATLNMILPQTARMQLSYVVVFSIILAVVR